ILLQSTCRAGRRLARAARGRAGTAPDRQRRAGRQGHPAGNLQRPRGSEETLVSAPAATAGNTDDESRHRQLTVLAGWQRFVDEEPAPPELLPDREWRQLGDP